MEIIWNPLPSKKKTWLHRGEYVRIPPGGMLHIYCNANTKASMTSVVRPDYQDYMVQYNSFSKFQFLVMTKKKYIYIYSLYETRLTWEGSLCRKYRLHFCWFHLDCWIYSCLIAWVWSKYDNAALCQNTKPYLQSDGVSPDRMSLSTKHDLARRLRDLAWLQFADVLLKWFWMREYV